MLQSVDDQSGSHTEPLLATYLIADIPEYENPRVDYCVPGTVTRAVETRAV